MADNFTHVLNVKKRFILKNIICQSARCVKQGVIWEFIHIHIISNICMHLEHIIKYTLL